MKVNPTVFFKKIPGSTWLVFATVTLLSACSYSGYEQANQLYKKQSYAAAIERYDRFLYDVNPKTGQYVLRAKNGALQTQAEQERSDCYLQLGKRAMERSNWVMGIRFLFLANSQAADELMDNCYWELVKIAKNENNTDQVLTYYDYILANLGQSELIPEILYDRIQVNMQQFNNDEAAWNDYIALCTDYAGTPFRQQAQTYIDTFVNSYIDDAVAMKSYISPLVSLERLSELSKYPTKYNDRINKEIATIYMQMAEDHIAAKEYAQAEEHFRQAQGYNPQLAQTVSNRLQGICQLFLQQGQELMANREPAQAIAIYKRCFNIIPNWQPAVNAIAKAESSQESIVNAKDLIAQGDTAFRQKNYSKALQLYRQGVKLDPLPQYKNKIFLTGNMIEIEKDPQAFALSIIKNYHNGRLVKQLNALETSQRNRYGTGVRSSGWKVLYSLGQDKYEVRYDIFGGGGERWFFVWQVNLRTRKISALNKNTEEFFAMEGK